MLSIDLSQKYKIKDDNEFNWLDAHYLVLTETPYCHMKLPNFHCNVRNRNPASGKRAAPVLNELGMCQTPSLINLLQ